MGEYDKSDFFVQRTGYNAGSLNQSGNPHVSLQEKLLFNFGGDGENSYSLVELSSGEDVEGTPVQEDTGYPRPPRPEGPPHRDGVRITIETGGQNPPPPPVAPPVETNPPQSAQDMRDEAEKKAAEAQARREASEFNIQAQRDGHIERLNNVTERFNPVGKALDKGSETVDELLDIIDGSITKMAPKYTKDMDKAVNMFTTKSMETFLNDKAFESNDMKIALFEYMIRATQEEKAALNKDNSIPADIKNLKLKMLDSSLNVYNAMYERSGVKPKKTPVWEKILSVIPPLAGNLKTMFPQQARIFDLIGTVTDAYNGAADIQTKHSNYNATTPWNGTADPNGNGSPETGGIESEIEGGTEKGSTLDGTNAESKGVLTDEGSGTVSDSEGDSDSEKK